MRIRIDGIKAMSGGISGAKQEIILANTGNRGQVCLFYQNKMMINSHAKFTAQVLTRFKSLLFAVRTSMVTTLNPKK